MSGFKKLLESVPFLGSLDSKTHWCTGLAITPLALVLIGQAKPPETWIALAYLTLHVGAFLIAARLFGWRDHVLDTKPEPPYPTANPPQTTPPK